jgi:hypothetical protein
MSHSSFLRNLMLWYSARAYLKNGGGSKVWRISRIAKGCTISPSI